MNRSTRSVRDRFGEAAEGRVVVGTVVVLVSVLVLPVPIWLVVLVVAMASRPRDTVVRTYDRLPTLRSWLIVSLVFVGSAVLSLLGNPVTGHGVQLILWFSLLPAIGAMFWMQGRRRYTVEALWLGTTVGASLAGVIAVAQVGIFDAPRATGVVANSITFGNLALVMGAMSVALHRLVDLPRNAVRVSALVAAVLGLTASILSGARGGWLVVPMLVVLLLWQIRGELNSRRVGRLAIGLVGVLAVANILSDGMPTSRASASVTHVSAYTTETSGSTSRSEAAGSSEGARIEAWRSASDAFEEQPLTGIGWGNLGAHFDRDVALGLRNERIAEFDHAHNQLLGAAANGGVIGLATMLALFAVPMISFGRAVRSSDPRRHTLGLTGITVLLSFAVFGLTEATLENLAPVTFLAVVMAALCVEIDRCTTERAGTAPGRSARVRRPEPSRRRRPLTPIAYGWIAPFGIHY